MKWLVQPHKVHTFSEGHKNLKKNLTPCCFDITQIQNKVAYAPNFVVFLEYLNFSYMERRLKENYFLYFIHDNFTFEHDSKQTFAFLMMPASRVQIKNSGLRVLYVTSVLCLNYVIWRECQMSNICYCYLF